MTEDERKQLIGSYRRWWTDFKAVFRVEEINPSVLILEAMDGTKQEITHNINAALGMYVPASVVEVAVAFIAAQPPHIRERLLLNENDKDPRSPAFYEVSWRRMSGLLEPVGTIRHDTDPADMLSGLKDFIWKKTEVTRPHDMEGELEFLRKENRELKEGLRVLRQSFMTIASAAKQLEEIERRLEQLVLRDD